MMGDACIVKRVLLEGKTERFVFLYILVISSLSSLRP